MHEKKKRVFCVPFKGMAGCRQLGTETFPFFVTPHAMCKLNGFFLLYMMIKET